MKIFMLCNVAVPIVSELEGKDICVFGGWLDDVTRFLIKENELTICYMSDSNTYSVSGKNTYVGFVETEAEKVISKLLNDNSYDLFHIWGTEYLHSYICVSILEKKNMLNRCVVSLQGIVSVYAHHYTEGITSEYLVSRKVRDYLFGNTILEGLRSFKQNGKYEKELLKKVKHVIGRTKWDKACLRNINENAVYHFCNENLRECFYESNTVWDIDKCNKYSIFVSQCSYPIKGFHYLLETMPLILDKYPEAKIVTTGEDFMSLFGWKKYRLDTYRKYLNDLIVKNNLNNKIEFRGILSAEEMRKEYLSANVFVCPSSIENSPNSVGEAMLMGCPVVASYVGGIMDMLEKDKEGYLYQTSSPEMMAYYIMKVFENSDRTIQISKNARIRAENTHNRTANNNRLLDIYQEIIHNSNY